MFISLIFNLKHFTFRTEISAKKKKPRTYINLTLFDPISNRNPLKVRSNTFEGGREKKEEEFTLVVEQGNSANLFPRGAPIRPFPFSVPPPLYPSFPPHPPSTRLAKLNTLIRINGWRAASGTVLKGGCSLSSQRGPPARMDARSQSTFTPIEQTLNHRRGRPWDRGPSPSPALIGEISSI